jgi:hypothetical protein
VLHATAHAVRVGRAAGEELGGEAARGVALAGARGAVEQVRVRGPALEGGAEDGGGVRVSVEDHEM